MRLDDPAAKAAAARALHAAAAGARLDAGAALAEIGHVAIGNRWYRWYCERDGLDPLAHEAALFARYGAPRPKPPFNFAARRDAGFDDAELRTATPFLIQRGLNSKVACAGASHSLSPCDPSRRR